MEVPGVDVRQRPEVEVPGIRVVGFEIEVRIRVLVRLLVHGILERVALAQRAVAMVVVVHPLIGGRRLLRDRGQRRMRPQQRHRRCQAVVRDTEHPDLAVVVRHVLDQPFDRVVGVRRLAGCFRVLEVGLRRQLEGAFGSESAAQVLDDEDVAVARQLAERSLAGVRRARRHAVGRSAKQDRQRPSGVGRREDHRFELDAVPDRHHDLAVAVGRGLRRALKDENCEREEERRSLKFDV